MGCESGLDGIEGIVLDAVGTLIEPRPSVSEAYAIAARSQGVEIGTDVVKRRFVASFATEEFDDQRGPLATDEPTERRRWLRIVRTCLPEVSDLDRAFADLWEHFGNPASWAVFPEVPPALNRLAARGVRLCVGSNFDARLRRVIAGKPELCELADRLVISSEVGYRKPHPQFYAAAARRLGLAPDRVLCLGDDPENDGRGPIRAGLRAHLVVRSGEAPPGLRWSRDLTGFADSLDRSEAEPPSVPIP